MKKIKFLLLGVLLIGAFLSACAPKVSLSTPPAPDAEPMFAYIGGADDQGLGYEVEMRPFTLKDGSFMVITPSALVLEDGNGNIEAFVAANVGVVMDGKLTTLAFGAHRLDLTYSEKGVLTKVTYQGELTKNKTETATIGDHFLLPTDMLTAVTEAVTAKYAATH